MSRVFESVLIANRGEIACRIVRSCRALGLSSIAIHSFVDTGALHTSLADKAVLISGGKPSDGYLDGQQIIDAALSQRAGAVHPGYGFLSENAEFASQVRAAGLVWIGPEPEQIRLMGDKARAREVARRAGVPVVPGTERVAANDPALVDKGDRIGYPLLVKAVAGGGGIGMRRVNRREDLFGAVAATSRLAQRSFSDEGVYLERYYGRARHIEVQVFGFGDGRVVHLGERDCSIQRRFQKVIEESPAPGLPETTRVAMWSAALALARNVSYRGAGTIEFIYDTLSGEFYFLEMNTRIQVEHPITEAVYDLDLVRCQLALELEELTLEKFQGLAPRGHAIECRLYAEDPKRAFVPSPGVIRELSFPTEENIRVDSGYRRGDRVSIYYDPLIAKIIAHAPTRGTAITLLQSMLSVVRVEGIKTNLEFLKATTGRPDYLAGDLHTRFLDEAVS